MHMTTSHSLVPAPSVDQWHYSATQLELVRLCPKKYHYKYVEGMKEPETPGKSLGSLVHETVEPWLQQHHWYGGRDPIPSLNTQEEILAEKLFTEWADRDRWMLLDTETDVRWQDPESGLHFRVKKDVAAQEKPTALYFVGDHKTTSDVEKYAKTGSQLRSDVQGLLYARSFFAHYPELDLVGLRWVYVQTKGKSQVRIVEEVVSRDHVSSKWEGILELARKAEEIRLKRIEPERKMFACSAYGGCAFAETCKGAMFRKREGVVMGLLKDVRGKMAEKTPERPTVTINPPASIPPPPSDQVADIRAQIAAARTAAPKKKVAARAPAKVEVEEPVEETPVFLDEIPAEKTNPGVRGFPICDEELPSTRRRAAKARVIGTLYVDCYPIGEEPPTTLEDIAAMIDPPEEGHYRLVEYGKGVPMMELAILRYLEESPVKAVSLSFQSPLGRDLYSALAAVSDRIVRGL